MAYYLLLRYCFNTILKIWLQGENILLQLRGRYRCMLKRLLQQKNWTEIKDITSTWKYWICLDTWSRFVPFWMFNFQCKRLCTFMKIAFNIYSGLITIWHLVCFLECHAKPVPKGYAVLVYVPVDVGKVFWYGISMYSRVYILAKRTSQHHASRHISLF